IGEVCYTKYRPAVEMPTISSGELLNDCRDCVESSSSDSSSDSSSSWSSTSSESSYSSESSDSGDSTTSEPSSPSESSSSQPSEPTSSDDIQHCHKCGNYCFSDKSAIRLNSAKMWVIDRDNDNGNDPWGENCTGNTIAIQGIDITSPVDVPFFEYDSTNNL